MEKRKGISIVKLLIVLFCVILICGTVIFIIVSCSGQNQFSLTSLLGQNEAELSSTIIETKLQYSSELISAKVNFRGLARYSDEGIPVLTKGDFVMVYTATVKAGIDVKDIGVCVDNSQQTVYFYVPQAEILDVKVDSDSIEFFDEKFTLFNGDEKADFTKALQYAEEISLEDAKETGILDLANEQSQTLIKGILEESVQGYEMKFFNSKDEFDKKAKEVGETAVTEAAPESSTNNQ